MSSLISEKKAQENYALAKSNYDKAKKKTSTTILRWKPDWEGAARYYREACKYYKLTGNMAVDETIQALRESAIAHKEIGSWHTAAADVESAALLVRDEKHDPKLAAELYQESSLLYRAQGASYDKAAAMLVRAGECVGDTDVEAGVQYMKQACAIFEEENRAMFHDATFKKAIIFCVNHEKFGSARSLLQRQIKLQQQHLNPFEPDMYKNCLSIIVLRFHTQDYEKASEELQKFESLERFARSEECLAANEMIQAWEDADEEKFNATMKKQVFKYLINPIAVIARKLPFPQGGGNPSRGGDEGEPEQEEGAAAASSSSSAPKKKSRGKRIDLDEQGEIDLR